jgi:membrane-bound serine protease (ClpP class)
MARSGVCLRLGLALLAALCVASTAAAQQCLLRADVDGVVSGGTAEYLTRATREAGERGCQALLVVIDTPGGFLDATREIAQAFLDSPVPVVTWVGPSGARAGSAGVFLVLASHVAAMAPGTNIGAAHPVGLGGREAPDPTMAKKVENDAAAFARALAQQRGRDAAWAEAAVRESVSATADEARAQGVVEVVAPSVRALLDALDGRVVRVGDHEVTLRTAGAEVRPFPPSLRHRALEVLGDPNVAYFLMTLGMFALMIELSAPGLSVAGGLGLFLLLLAGIGLRMLPVDAGAIVLLVLAFGLFVAEVFVVSHGLLALGGIVALVLGSMLLIDTNDPDFFADRSFGVSWGLVVPMVAVLGAGAIALAWHANRVRKQAPVTGAEGLVGSLGRADTALGPAGGWVRVAGERWQAHSATPVAEGGAVRVVAVRDLVLDVVPIETEVR